MIDDENGRNSARMKNGSLQGMRENWYERWKIIRMRNSIEL